MTRPSPIPIIHTSLASGVPCWVGKGLFSLRMPGVLAYRPSRPPENAASPAPATAAGTTGSSRAAPRVISLTASSRTKSAGLSLARNGYAPAANPCSWAAASSSARSLPMPELRMNAPVATRCGRWCAFTENRMIPPCSQDDVQREPRSAAAVYQRGDFVPVHVVGDGLGQGPGEPQPGQLGRAPVVELSLVDDLVPGDRLDRLHRSSPVAGSVITASRRCRTGASLARLVPEDLLDPGAQACGRHRAGPLRRHLPVPQHHQRRDGHHVEALLQLGGVVHVD